jgi:hypothetical protein
MTGFTKVDNPVLEKVLTSNLTKRQLKILLLIIRFSSGCQKNYAVLRKNDYTYAGVSPYCITYELEKLVKLRVLRWDARRDMVWINPRLGDWAVDKPGGKPGDIPRRFFKIINKNLPKWQLAVYQNSKHIVVKKENINKDKESSLLRILSDYFLRVSPLTEEETVILRELVDRYHPRLVEKAIDALSAADNRSFSQFLKTLDNLASSNSPRREGLRSLRSSLKPFISKMPQP